MWCQARGKPLALQLPSSLSFGLIFEDARIATNKVTTPKALRWRSEMLILCLSARRFMVLVWNYQIYRIRGRSCLSSNNAPGSVTPQWNRYAGCEVCFSWERTLLLRATLSSRCNALDVFNSVRYNGWNVQLLDRKRVFSGNWTWVGIVLRQYRNPGRG